MGEGQFFDIVLFAMIAGFLVLRLRSVLGRRTGNERQRPDPFGAKRDRRTTSPQSPQPDDKVIGLPDHSARGPAEAAPTAADDPLAAGLTQVRIADPAFEPASFIDGAKAAFEMIIAGFAKGDAAMLRPLLNDSVYADFAAAIDERKKAGHTLETTLVGVKSADILEARVEGRVAFVTVKFVTEQVNVTRDSSGAVVEGDAARVAPVTDIWTFARNTRARDPNWTLVETRSPN
jgi:predicted lipid-binding transport protein (Tim44 family)